MSDNSGFRGRAIRAALIIVGAQVGGVLLLVLARTQGMIGWETATRGIMVLIGLGMAAGGNITPKMLDGPPPQSLRAAASKQATHRVGGWAWTLAGLAYAGLWAFAPFGVAATGGVVAVGAGIAVMFGYKAWRGFAHYRSGAS